MTTATESVAKDPTTPTGAEQQYLVYTTSTNAQGVATSQITWRGTKTQLTQQQAGATAQATLCATRLASIAALPA